ncbi:MAG: LEA type 2 family protein [Candidatus Korarchaeota archaeon]|nr:LEA type 2 family protein [Candidatus Korarchaeota archaeon]
MRAIHAVILISVLLGGLLLLDFKRALDAANSLEVRRINLKGLDVDLGWRFRAGIPPMEPYIKRINLELLIGLNNPSNYWLRIHELDYEIGLNGRLVANGSIRDIDVPPGERDITVPISVDPERAVSALLDSVISALRSGTTQLNLDYEVDGRARVPITVLGVELPIEVTVPFREVGTYRLSLSLPSVRNPDLPSNMDEMYVVRGYSTHPAQLTHGLPNGQGIHLRDTVEWVLEISNASVSRRCGPSPFQLVRLPLPFPVL